MTDMRRPIPTPPVQLAPFVQALGLEGTVAFLLEFGGSQLSISKKPRNNNQIVQIFGREAAEALGAMDLPARVPLAKPWLAAYFHAQGDSVMRIARRLHVSDVTVRNYLRAAEGRAKRR